MVRKVLVFICFIGLAVPGQAQDHAITGKITSAEGPLESATVLVAGTLVGETTGRDGSYRIKRVAGSNCELLISLVGYRSQRLRVTLSAGTTVVNVVQKTTLKVKSRPMLNTPCR